MIQFVEECAIAGNCESVQEDDGKGLAMRGEEAGERDVGGDEGNAEGAGN